MVCILQTYRQTMGRLGTQSKFLPAVFPWSAFYRHTDRPWEDWALRASFFQQFFHGLHFTDIPTDHGKTGHSEQVSSSSFPMVCILQTYRQTMGRLGTQSKFLPAVFPWSAFY